jgi:hypothetical protein
MSCFKCSAKAEAFTFGYARGKNQRMPRSCLLIPPAPAPLSRVALALVAPFACDDHFRY